jgi:hypothetical protein
LGSSFAHSSDVEQGRLSEYGRMNGHKYNDYSEEG